MSILDTCDRDLYKGHQLLQQRLPLFIKEANERGVPLAINEIFRSDDRQKWLYAQGRTQVDCTAKGIDPSWARSGPIVTNAWSALTSAHGHMEDGLPAACAADLVPVGADGKPWTKDDDWAGYITTMEPIANKYGLRHFHAPGKAPTDKPHIQLVEWDDASLTLKTAVPA